jgi:hypothetical protein
MPSDAPPKQASRTHTCIVEDHQFVAAEERGQLSKLVIFPGARGPAQEQKTGRVAALERALRDLLAREMVVQLVQTHAGSLPAIAQPRTGGGRSAGGGPSAEVESARLRASFYP